MRERHTKRCELKKGFSILEMLMATTILLVGLVAVAQLVPDSLLLNLRNRNDSAALVFAQRELDHMLAQPLSSSTFTDVQGVYCPTGSLCNLGAPGVNGIQGNNVLVINNQAAIDFGNPQGVPGYSFVYQDPNDPASAAYDVRWAVIVTGLNGKVSSKRFILGVGQAGRNGFFPPVTIDTMVEQ